MRVSRYRKLFNFRLENLLKDFDFCYFSNDMINIFNFKIIFKQVFFQCISVVLQYIYLLQYDLIY